MIAGAVIRTVENVAKRLIAAILLNDVTLDTVAVR